jgi:hypothetical protein
LDERLAKPARQAGEFFVLPDQSCELHRSVSEFANASKDCALSLVVRG